MKFITICRKGRLVIFISIFFLIELSSYASPLTATRGKLKNCYIHTKATTRALDVQKKTIGFDYKTKSECEKMRRILSDNFDPKNIVKSEARMDWRGK